MKKSPKKLSVRKETLRQWDEPMAQVAGGVTGVCPGTTHGEDCFTSFTIPR